VVQRLTIHFERRLRAADFSCHELEVSRVEYGAGAMSSGLDVRAGTVA
jgi:hypothetical protein